MFVQSVRLHAQLQLVDRVDIARVRELFDL
jgi:hypothetical protein